MLVSDIAIESGVVSPVKRALDGKTYKRAIWFQLIYETCLRFIPKEFLEWLIEAKPTEKTFAKFGTNIEVIC